MWNHRITMTCFRTCSTCQSRSQAPFCHYTLRLVSNQPEGTFARLRYCFGGDRPSQTAHQALSYGRLNDIVVRRSDHQGWYFKVASLRASALSSKAPTYPTHDNPNVHAKLQ